MAWVVSGRRPGRIVASNQTATRTRPVDTDSTVARYDGTGSIDDAANFVPYTPRQEPRPDYLRVGERRKG